MRGLSMLQNLEKLKNGEQPDRLKKGSSQPMEKVEVLQKKGKFTADGKSVGGAKKDKRVPFADAALEIGF